MASHSWFFFMMLAMEIGLKRHIPSPVTSGKSKWLAILIFQMALAMENVDKQLFSSPEGSRISKWLANPH